MPSQPVKRSIQWGIWGNETALLGAYVLTIGGVIGIVGGVTQNFLFWLPIGIYGLIFGILMSFLEYPRGKKSKGNTVTRWHQSCFSSMVSKLPVVSNYYYRAFIYFVVCLPTLIIVPTFLGSACVMIGCGIYFGAAAHGESWSPVVPRSQPQRTGGNVSEPPAQPPPRLPQHTGARYAT
ncbi:unnamed protein product [Clavelina lepadiformis]|uniref:Cytochrome b-245 light chain n=1 Tax=Clavelina lepadiformis TaxID=159417 RepID=A0ABP0G1S7_CLALP